MNEVVIAVANHINTRFSPIKIYTEEVLQGAPSEYFFVNFITSGRSKLVGGRYEKTISLDIIFDAEKNKRVREVMDILDHHFRYVPFGGYPLRPTGFTQNVTDGIGHTLIDFSLHLFEQTPLWDKMKTLYFEGGVRSG